MQTLMLIRGLPGSGKSTLAQKLTQFHHFEADMFFIDADGEYKFDASKLTHAHNWCREAVAHKISIGESCVVSNTFSQLWEMLPYFRIAKRHKCQLVVSETTGQWQSIHNVPKEVIEKMQQRWEQLSPKLSSVLFRNFPF